MREKKRTWLVVELGPQEIDFSRKTSAGGDGEGGDGDLSDCGGDGAVEGGGACGGGCGCDGVGVGGGENGAQRRRHREFRRNLVENAAELAGAPEADEAVAVALESAGQHCVCRGLA